MRSPDTEPGAGASRRAVLGTVLGSGLVLLGACRIGRADGDGVAAADASASSEATAPEVLEVSRAGRTTDVSRGSLLGRASAPASNPVLTSNPSPASAPSATSKPLPSSAPDAQDERAAAAMPVRAALAQLLVVGLPNLDSGAGRLLVAGNAPIGGLFLTRRDLRQLSPSVLAKIRAARVPVTIAVDDEGGRVQVSGAGRLPSARSMAHTLTVDQVRRVAARRGRLLAARGVTMVFAPEVDVSSQPAAAVIGDRSFGNSVTTVRRYATAYAQGLVDAGLTPVVKHFPGHGRAVGDSHKTLPRTPPVADLDAVDWVPLRAVTAATPAMVMMGHLSVPGLSTSGLPSSLDPAVYAALRGRVGFRGLVITDELANMRGVSARFPLGEAVRRALAAGADIALFNAGGAGTRVVSQVLTTLERAVETGSLPHDRVIASAAAVLALKRRSAAAR
jgi:beta-N-acetylhexosaminidase